MNYFLTEKNIQQFIPKLHQYLTQQGWRKTKENEVLSIWNKSENPTLATLLRLPKVRTEPFDDDVEFLWVALEKLAGYFDSTPEYLVHTNL